MRRLLRWAFSLAAAVSAVLAAATAACGFGGCLLWEGLRVGLDPLGFDINFRGMWMWTERPGFFRLPHPLVSLALFLPVLAWYLPRCKAQQLRRERRRAGQCIGCGYDLRATPERCPECGHVPEKGGATT